MIKFESTHEKLCKLTHKTFYTAESVRRCGEEFCTTYSISIFTDSGECKTVGSNISPTDAYNKLISRLSTERLAQ